MDKVYKINQYAKSTIEGLGYEVDTNSEGSINFQGINTIKDKSTGQSIYSSREKLLELSDEEWQRGDAQFLDGIPTDIYIGNNSESIELSKYGETDIRFTNGLKIHFPNFNEESKSMEIVLEDSEGKRLNITYYGIDYKYEYYDYLLNKYDYYNYLRNSIEVSTGHFGDAIATINEQKTQWYGASKTFEISECTPTKVTKRIISRIKAYENGKYWNEEFKQGLEIIAPAIALMVLEFKKSWIKQIDEYVEKEEKNQKKAKQTIEALIEQIANSEINVAELVRAQDEIARSLNEKQIQKRINKTQIRK